MNLAHLTAYPDAAGALRLEGFLSALHPILGNFATAEQNRKWTSVLNASLSLRNFLAADAEHISDFLSLTNLEPPPVSVLVDLLSSATGNTPHAPGISAFAWFSH